MAGCGRLSAGVRNPGQPPRTAAAEPSGVSAAVRPQRRRVHAGRTLTASHVRRAGSVTVGVSAHRSTRPAAGHHGGHVRRSAAVAAGRCAAQVRTLTGDAARVADTYCPQRGQRTGRCPPAQRPAAMTVEAAAEGPQRFRPGGGDGTGCRTPDRSRWHPAWTPRLAAGRRGRAQDRTPQAADGQSADRSLVTTSSTLPSRPALRAAACGGRPRPSVKSEFWFHLRPWRCTASPQQAKVWEPIRIRTRPPDHSSHSVEALASALECGKAPMC
jgi:hypothetical protein